jgi:hypothetical protein
MNSSRHNVTSLNLSDCKNVGFQKLVMKLCAYEIIKDVFLFPSPKILEFTLSQSIILELIKC